MPDAIDLDVDHLWRWIASVIICRSCSAHESDFRLRRAEHYYDAPALFPAGIVGERRGRDCLVLDQFFGVYSGGSGGGTGLLARAANSSGNFSTKLWVGQAQASPNAQMVRPAILSRDGFQGVRIFRHAAA